MAKFKYSVVRFVPSPVRGERVNLGLIVGSDETGEWTMDIVEKRTRAQKLDDAKIFPMVAAEIERLQARLAFSEEFYDAVDGDFPSEKWLSDVASSSQNVLQFSKPQSVLAGDVTEAVEMLWNLFIVEPETRRQEGMQRRTLIAKCFKSFERKLGSEHLKRNVHLEIGKVKTGIDLAVHNGVVKQLTQCWSFQMATPADMLKDVRAWGWTLHALRDHGGQITGSGNPITVPADVKIGVVYAPNLTSSAEANEVFEQAMEVFKDKDVQADCVTVEQLEATAIKVANLITH